MRAVVLAAGRGKRLGALTDDTPKPLLVAGGKTLVEHVLGGVAAAGIADVAVVCGYRSEQVAAFVGDGNRWGLRCAMFQQAVLDGTARGTALARDFLGEGAFLFAWGDVLVRPENYAAVVAGAKGLDGALAVNQVDDPSIGAAVYVDGEGIVLRLVEKPPPGTSRTPWNNAGIGVAPPGTWDAIERLEPDQRGEWTLPAAIAAVIDQGARLKAVPISGPWFDIGTPESLAKARSAWESE